MSKFAHLTKEQLIALLERREREAGLLKRGGEDGPLHRAQPR